MRAATCRFVECLAMSRQPLDRGPGPANVTSEAALRPPGVHGGEPEGIPPRSCATPRRALSARSPRRTCAARAPRRARRGWSHPGGDRRAGTPNPAARGAAAALGAMPAALLLAAVKSPRSRRVPLEPSLGRGFGLRRLEPRAASAAARTVPAWRAAMDAARRGAAVRGGPEARGARPACARSRARRASRGRSSRRRARAPPAGLRRRRRRRDRRGRGASRVRARASTRSCVDNRPPRVVGPLVAIGAIRPGGGGAGCGRRRDKRDFAPRPRARDCLRALKQAAEKIDRVRAAAGAAPASSSSGDGARARASARRSAGGLLAASSPLAAGAAALGGVRRRRSPRSRGWSPPATS